MRLEKIEVENYKNIIKKQKIKFAIPDKENEGSGLTVITGVNNSGKSNILECIIFFNYLNGGVPVGNSNIEIKEFLKRFSSESNKDNCVQILYNGTISPFTSDINEQEENLRIYSLDASRVYEEAVPTTKKYGEIKKRKHHFFSNDYLVFINSDDRDNSEVMKVFEFYWKKVSTLKIKKIHLLGLKEKKEYETKHNLVPSEFKGEDLNTQSFYAFELDSININNIGDGIVSLFSIIMILSIAVVVDTNKDNNCDVVVTIDEPELALHPHLQKILLNIIMELSKNIQIIISTHSPYFINFKSIINKTEIIRISNDKNESMTIHQLSNSKKMFKNEFKNICNPHVFGLDAKEIFFLNDNILLLEGQEDVILYPVFFKELAFDFSDINIYGWGMGGADNINLMCSFFKELGFKKVICIVDNDRKNILCKHEKNFTDYLFLSIPADDIRKGVDEGKSNKPLLSKKDEEYELNKDYKEEATKLICSIRDYLVSD